MSLRVRPLISSLLSSKPRLFSLVEGPRLRCCGRPLSSASSPAPLDYKAYYSTQDLEKVLKTVNEIGNLDDLQKFGFPKRAIKVLGERRERKGATAVEDIDQLIAILGSRSSFRAFGNILEKPNASVKNPMFPVLGEEIVENCSTVVSVVLNGSQISWSSVERCKQQGFVVKEWDCHALEFKAKQHFISSLRDMVQLASKKIPVSDLCVVEEYPSTVPNPQMFQYQLQITQLRSFLLGSLAAKMDPSKIIAVKTLAVARLFNTAVGSERVSGQHLVDNMITWKPVPSLIVPNSLKDMYEGYTPVVKEGLANSILLNLAYWRLTKQFTDTYS